MCVCVVGAGSLSVGIVCIQRWWFLCFFIQKYKLLVIDLLIHSLVTVCMFVCSYPYKLSSLLLMIWTLRCFVFFVPCCDFDTWKFNQLFVITTGFLDSRGNMGMWVENLWAFGHCADWLSDSFWRWQMKLRFLGICLHYLFVNTG